MDISSYCIFVIVLDALVSQPDTEVIGAPDKGMCCCRGAKEKQGNGDEHAEIDRQVDANDTPELLLQGRGVLGSAGALWQPASSQGDEGDDAGGNQGGSRGGRR